MKLTKAKFKRKAEAAFRKSNPGSDVTIEWVSARVVKYPTGVVGYTGTFTATAPGYKGRTMLASGDDEYVMVR